MRSSNFVNHSYDYKPNWTPLSPVTITYYNIIIIIVIIIIINTIIIIIIIIIITILSST